MTRTKTYGTKILMNMFARAMVNLLISVYLSRLELAITDKNYMVFLFVSVRSVIRLLTMLFFMFIDIIEDLYSPRTAAMDFVSELVRKRGKNNLQKFIHFVVDIFRRYCGGCLSFVFQLMTA